MQRRKYVLALMGLLALSFIVSGCFSFGEKLSTIKGIVTQEPEGTPLADATLTLGNLTTKTNSEGAYEFKKVKAGNYTLSVTVDGEAVHSQVIRVKDDGATITLNVKVASDLERGSVVGVLEYADGQPVTQHEIHLGEIKTTTDDAGRFEFRDTVYGTYILQATVRGIEWVREITVDTADVDLGTIVIDTVAFPITFDPNNAAHRAMFEPLFGTVFDPKVDRFGETHFFIGDELANMPSDTYDLRHVVIQTEDLAQFSLQFESLGVGVSGNPSHFITFGWQDHKNYYYVYPGQTTASRVARVVDGVHQTLYNHGKEIWERSWEKYQTLRVELKRNEGKAVVDIIANGELVLSYTFASGQEPPAGKVGLAMWNDDKLQSFFKNITLDVK